MSLLCYNISIERRKYSGKETKRKTEDKRVQNQNQPLYPQFRNHNSERLIAFPCDTIVSNIMKKNKWKIRTKIRKTTLKEKIQFILFVLFIIIIYLILR